MLQKKKSDKRPEDSEPYKLDSKANGTALESKHSKESLPDSDGDPDGDSDGGANQTGSKNRPRESNGDDALDKHAELSKNAKLRSTSTSNARNGNVIQNEDM